MKNIPHLVLASLFAMGTAFAGEKLDFSKHDKNNDGYLSENEWTEASFDKLDKNGDGRLEARELTGTTLQVKTDQQVTAGRATQRDEQPRSAMWETGQQQRGERQQSQSQRDKSEQGRQAFTEADTDRDNQLTEDEARVAGYEYVVVYFDPLDANKDGVLDEEEWDLNQREELQLR